LLDSGTSERRGLAVKQEDRELFLSGRAWRRANWHYSWVTAAQRMRAMVLV